MLNAVSIHKNPGAHWKFPFCPSEYSLLLQAMLDETEHTGMTVELALLDDAAMEHLNRASTGCAGPTNILAFPVPAATAGGRACLSPPYGGDKHARLSLGCLALSVDTLLRECFLYGQNTDEHCIRLLAHGLSHLMGMDHGPEMDSLADRLAQSAHAALLSR